MKRLLFICLMLLSFTLLSACSEGPGELEGTWRLHGSVPMTVVYRGNEEEAMGIISQVSYKHEGNHVLVTYESDIAKGNAIRFTRVDKNTYRSELSTLKRVR